MIYKIPSFCTSFDATSAHVVDNSWNKYQSMKHSWGFQNSLSESCSFVKREKPKNSFPWARNTRTDVRTWRKEITCLLKAVETNCSLKLSSFFFQREHWISEFFFSNLWLKSILQDQLFDNFSNLSLQPYGRTIIGIYRCLWNSAINLWFIGLWNILVTGCINNAGNNNYWTIFMSFLNCVCKNVC